LFREGPATDDAVRLAAALGLDRVVAHQPMGFDTKVAHGATDALPGGVRQRIALVRALGGDPAIVLFDEANASLDGDSDERLRAPYAAALIARRTARGWRGDPRALLEALPHVAADLDLLDCRNVLAAIGLPTRPLRARLDALEPRLLPCLFRPRGAAAPVVVLG